MRTQGGKQWLSTLAAAAVTAAGFAVWVAIGRAVRANLFALDHDIVFARGFAMCVLAALGVSALMILRGVEATPRCRVGSKMFLVIEAPLTLVVAAVSVSVVNAWRIVGDMFPQNRVEPTEQLPFVIGLIVNPWKFYALTVTMAVAALFVFARHLRSSADA